MRTCDIWVCEYGGGGKDIVKSGSIVFYSQRNNLRFVVLGVFVNVESEDGDSSFFLAEFQAVYMRSFFHHILSFLPIDTPGIQSQDAWFQRVPHVPLVLVIRVEAVSWRPRIPLGTSLSDYTGFVSWS